jgi:hypothetical protein
MRPQPQTIPTPEWTAKVAEWNAEKGYGWLQWADKRVFLHRRDFSGPSISSTSLLPMTRRKTGGSPE